MLVIFWLVSSFSGGMRTLATESVKLLHGVNNLIFGTKLGQSDILNLTNSCVQELNPQILHPLYKPLYLPIYISSLNELKWPHEKINASEK